MTRLTPLGVDPSRPEGLAEAYALGAGDLVKDARFLDEQLFSDRTGHYILTLHAIELALKAFLIGKGYTEESLRSKPFGHDLVELYKAAQSKGLVLATPDADGLIDWINEWHFYSVKIRYEFTKDRQLPTCAVLIPLATEIIQTTLRLANPPPAVQTSVPMPDRVSPLNPDNTPFEVHSVPIGVDPYVYARRLIERGRNASQSDRHYLVERNGVESNLSADEVVTLAATTDTRGAG
jgi:hypothetical protein